MTTKKIKHEDTIVFKQSESQCVKMAFPPSRAGDFNISGTGMSQRFANLKMILKPSSSLKSLL